MKGLSIRDARAEDTLPLGKLMHDAVHGGAAAHYDRAQRDAWCPVPPCGPEWAARLAGADTVVAELQGRLVGFMSLDLRTGVLDLAYVRADLRGTGVAATLYAVVEGRARAAGLSELQSEASLLAERFLLRRGWQRVARQTVERGGVSIPNARMEKSLSAEVNTLTCAAF